MLENKVKGIVILSSVLAPRVIISSRDNSCRGKTDGKRPIGWSTRKHGSECQRLEAVVSLLSKIKQIFKNVAKLLCLFHLSGRSQ